jgi:signal transduction histidine kinase
MFNDLDLSLSNQAQTIYKFVSESNVDLMDFQPDSIYTSKEDYVYDLIFDALVLNPRNTFVQVKFNNNLVFQSDNLKKHAIILNTKNPRQISLIDFNDAFLSDHTLRGALLKTNKYEIIVAFPTYLISETLENLTDINIIIGPIFLVLAVIGGAIISSKSLSRIDSIINKTKEITAQNLDEKIPGGDYDDEYGRLVRTMNDMILRIKTAIDYMNQFSIAASHELKTPLTILRGEIEIALKSPKPADAYRQVLESNYEETIRLINIVDKLFFLSKVDHSLLKLKKEQINIVELLQPAVNQMRSFAEAKNMRIKFVKNTEFELLVDIDLMRRAVINLIENAIKYGDEFTDIIITCSLDKSDEAIISVTNQGENIPGEFHEKIFERFFRLETSRSRETGGIGLGLSIVRSIVEFHKGLITVSSEKEKGNCFSIHLNTKEI